MNKKTLLVAIAALISAFSTSTAADIAATNAGATTPATEVLLNVSTGTTTVRLNNGGSGSYASRSRGAGFLL